MRLPDGLVAALPLGDADRLLDDLAGAGGCLVEGLLILSDWVHLSILSSSLLRGC